MDNVKARDRLRVVGTNQAWEDPGPLCGDEPIDPTDLYAPPIEEGEYDAAYIDQQLVEGMFRNSAAKWIVTMKIEGGPHAGRHLLFALPCLERGRPRPTFKYSRLYAAVSRGRRLPRDLWRRSPRNLLAETIVRVRVITVKRDAAGALKAESLWYSKIDEVIGIVAGCPPAFRGMKS